jgi:hypothetical protein
MSAMLAHQQAGFDPAAMSLTCTEITPRIPHCLAGLRGLELANAIFGKPLKQWANSFGFAEHCGT